jgi:hypothetical protein
VTDMYKPGDIVPKDGTVMVTQKPEIRDHVKKGTRFPPPSRDEAGGVHERESGYTWQYTDEM